MLFFCIFAAGIYNYMGCYKDNQYDRDMPHMEIEDQKMTIGVCVEHCLKYGYKYAGMEVRKQWNFSILATGTLARARLCISDVLTEAHLINSRKPTRIYAHF